MATTTHQSRLTTHQIRIGNGCGFWGDNLDAPILLAQHGKLDYLTLDYLAELTMSILALQKQRDPQAGFASDFLDVLERLCPILREQPSLKVVTNAGGMNPLGCAAKAREILKKNGLKDRKVATVSGDDLFPRLDELLAEWDPHQESSVLARSLCARGDRPLSNYFEVAQIVLVPLSSFLPPMRMARPGIETAVIAALNSPLGSRWLRSGSRGR